MTLDHGGIFQAGGAGDLVFTNAFKVNRYGGAIDNNGVKLTLSGVIANGDTGTGVLQLTGPTGGGLTVLSGTNTYAGGTKVVGTTVRVTNNSSVGSGTVTLEGARFQAAGVSDLSFANSFKINNTVAGSGIDSNGVALTIAGNITNGSGAGKLSIFDSSVAGTGVVVLTGTNTYSGGTKIGAGATLQLGDTTHTASIVGAVSNDGVFDIIKANTAGMTSISQSGVGRTTFRNSTTAGTMTIDNNDFGTLEFRQTSSAANATINNHGTTAFYDDSTAGNATINNSSLSGQPAFEFNNSSKAGTATINNYSYVTFNDHATLENAKIINNGTGNVLFNSQSSAGTALASITNHDFGTVIFVSDSTAGGATIINSSSAYIAFSGQSTAGNAFITTKNHARTLFQYKSDGGTARFETEAGGKVDFSTSRDRTTTDVSTPARSAAPAPTSSARTIRSSQAVITGRAKSAA